MNTIRVRVENGKLVGDAPPGFAEGTELLLQLAELEDDLTPQELSELEGLLDRGWACLEAGQVRPAEAVLADLRRRR